MKLNKIEIVLLSLLVIVVLCLGVFTILSYNSTSTKMVGVDCMISNDSDINYCYKENLIDGKGRIDNLSVDRKTITADAYEVISN